MHYLRARARDPAPHAHFTVKLKLTTLLLGDVGEISLTSPTLASIPTGLGCSESIPSLHLAVTCPENSFIGLWAAD
jgi:hypothetical protein